MRDYTKTGFDPKEKLQLGDRLVVPKNKNEYYLYGQVGHGGTVPYPEDKKLTVYQVIADSGGQVEGAELKHARLTRKRPDGSTISQEVNVEKMLKTGDLTKDVAVEPGDSIYVPGSYRRPGINVQEAFQFIVALTGIVAVLNRWVRF